MKGNPRTSVSCFLAVFSGCIFLLFSAFSQAADYVDISGIVEYNGTPVCGLVLANGEQMFSCSEDGSYALTVPLEADGKITLFGFVSGLAPFQHEFSPAELVNYTISMSAAGDEPVLTVSFTTGNASQAGWVGLSGTVDLDGIPACGLVLANGQHMFSCDDSSGVFNLEVPLDDNNQITLFVFASGSQPYEEVITVEGGATVANVIEVGPGRTHEDLATIDWPNLMAGDEVRIYWRAEPYRSKIGLRSRGTADAPIRIVGIADSNGQRPVISGRDATTPSSLNNFFSKEWTEGLGVIVIHRGDEDEWGYKPGYIEIEGLKIEGGYHEYQYTGMDGGTYNYFEGAAGIWAVLVEHFEVRDCEITDNGNGFFVLSKNNDEAETSRDVVLETSFLHTNGNVGSDQEHAIYTQVAGIVFQYNRIGSMRAGAWGSSLKDRSADTVIRYNWIVSGARTLDLVEPEDSYAILMEESGFSDTWVYGNILINEYSPTYSFATSMIHYGGDIGDPAIYRKGTLHFYHNTVYLNVSQPEVWYVNLFDLSTNDETVELDNNVFYLNGDSILNIGRDAGIHIFSGNNWLNAGWEESNPDTEWHTFTGTVTVNTAPLEGSSPGFTDAANYDFSVPVGSALYGQAASLPTALSGHPVNRQYQLHQQSAIRQTEGAAAEIGAFEIGGGTIQ